MVYKKAERPAGAPTNVADDTDDDDLPTRAELIEAIGNLRIESERAYHEWQRVKPFGHKIAKEAEARWVGLLTRIDGYCVGVDQMDRITNEFNELPHSP